jgi:hypothetical protein
MHQIQLDEAIRLVRGNATIFSNTTVNMLEYMAQFHAITVHETTIFERDFDVEGIHIMPHRLVAKRLFQCERTESPGMLIAFDDVIAQHVFLSGPALITGTFCVSGNMVLESHGEWGLMVEKDLRVDTLIELHHDIDVAGELTARHTYRRGHNIARLSPQFVCQFQGEYYPDHARVISGALKGERVVVN